MRKSGSRTVQHRPERESEEKEKRRLKRENRELKKQVTRLRREVEKSQEIRNSAQAVLDEHQQSLADQEGGPSVICEACGGRELTGFKLPAGGTLWVCKSCKHKKKEA